MRVLKLLLAIAVTSLAVKAAAGAESFQATAAAPVRQCATTVTVALKPGLLRRMFATVKEDRDCWVESICKAVSGFSQAEYNRFLKLAREESIALSDTEWATRSREAQHFRLYTNRENRLRAYQCLEQHGEGAPPDVRST